MQVDCHNFFTVYPKLVEEIKESTFIAVDLEFTGLFVNKDYMPTLFDTLDERYAKLKTNASTFVPCQLGLSLFTRHETKNEYTARTYSFFCCPRVYGLSADSFGLEIGAIEFLVNNSFDFNRFAKDGIPFLNETQEKTFRDLLINKSINDVSHTVTDRLSELRKKILEWMTKLPLQDGRRSGETQLKYEPLVNPLMNYLVVDYLRSEYKGFWVSPCEGGLHMRSVSPLERKSLLTTVKDEEEELITRCLGLSKLIREITSAKKPIVGNNMMSDLVMIYQHFIDPLPGDLKTFKQKILENFSVFYDVKSIITNVRKHIPAYEDDLQARNLEEYYQKLSSPTLIVDNPYQPKIVRADDTECEIVNRFHDAGSDAYATGYVFLRVGAMIASIIATETETKLSTEWKTLIEPLSPLKNKINLIRAAFHFLDLEAESQTAVRPEWLVLRSRDPAKPISLLKVSSILSSFNTTIDYRPLSKSEVILAIGNFRCAREMISKFKSNKEYKITRYNGFFDSKLGKMFLWTSLIASSGTTCYLAYKMIKSKY